MSLSPVMRLVPLAAAALVAVAALPASAEIVDPAPIGPGQLFYGVVNGQTGHAVIKMACFGPVYEGQTGHPMAGQTVKVLPAPSYSAWALGYTGTAADGVAVTGPLASTASRPIVLHTYAVAAEIPTTMTLPCYGTGELTFTPVPTSATARATAVKVDFVGQP
ncbi:hypothetical protein JOL79_00770 [Microbispora sp. RL4-1S]|uniref:Uncharacterized protein n=1 Tax=Microbispora oryzae TaxID=2806554 RepID=A0A941AH54_9ACTN|nr:hypothetical protein [Microbispora oryzae]MBP2702327.1 hypothetical protein [Microbispora oryzae]